MEPACRPRLGLLRTLREKKATPLTADDELHVEDLAQHPEDQAKAGLDSLLVAGFIDFMALLGDEVWRDLLAQNVQLN